nr:fad-dependent monooxygenase cctm [Quercus suber]
MRDMEVIIIGEGPTGLMLAQGLKQAGIAATVYEHKTTHLREWGMTLNWRNEAIAKLLPSELQARISEACCDSESEMKEDNVLPHYDGHNGELLFEQPAAKEMRVSRTKLRNLLAEGIDIQCENHVTAIFQDGTSAKASLIVGCDGSRSVARELLVGFKESQLQNMDISAFNFVCKFDAETAKLIRAHHPRAFNSYSKQNEVFWVSVQDIPDLSDPASWSFQLFFSWTGAPLRRDFATQGERTDFLRSRAPEYAEPWKTILSKIPDEADFVTDHIGLFTPFDWSDVPLEGRLTLAGDAAHSLSPYRFTGQGLNSGIKDAALLKDYLVAADRSDGGWFQAVRMYEEEMRTRALKDVPVSEAAGVMAHDYEQLVNQSLVVETGQMKVQDGRKEPRERIDSVWS